MEWERYKEIAGYYRWKVPPEDRDDMVQTIVLEMAEAAARRDGQETPKAYLEAIAHNVVCDYWRHRKRPTLSLNRPTRDSGGLELHEVLPGDTGDYDPRLDAKFGLKACPLGVQRIAHKLETGDPLTRWEQLQLARFRRGDGKETPAQRRYRERYRQRRASGLCVTCGEAAEPGLARCARCLESYRGSQALYKRRKGNRWHARLREHWRREGRCPRCGRVPELGRKKCPQCLAKDREHLRHWKARQLELGACVGVGA